MFISSAMSAVVTCGSPERLKVSALSRMLSRVRRDRFSAMVGTAEVEVRRV
jgi:hypothetical protein